MHFVFAALLGFVILIVLQIGASPSVITRPVEDDCNHVVIAQMFGTVTMVDSVVCGDQNFVWNGENLIEQSEEDF